MNRTLLTGHLRSFRRLALRR